LYAIRECFVRARVLRVVRARRANLDDVNSLFPRDVHTKKTYTYFHIYTYTHTHTHTYTQAFIYADVIIIFLIFAKLSREERCAHFYTYIYCICMYVCMYVPYTYNILFFSPLIFFIPILFLLKDVVCYGDAKVSSNRK
jgi:hypothetical protein